MSGNHRITYNTDRELVDNNAPSFIPVINECRRKDNKLGHAFAALNKRWLDDSIGTNSYKFMFSSHKHVYEFAKKMKTSWNKAVHRVLGCMTGELLLLR